MTKHTDTAKPDSDRPALISFEVPREVLSEGVSVLCEYAEDRGIGLPKLALGVLQAILLHPDFPLEKLVPRPDCFVSEGVQPFTEFI